MEDKVINEVLNAIKETIDKHQDNLLEKSKVELFFNSLSMLFVNMPMIMVILVFVSFLIAALVLLFSIVNVVTSSFKLIKSLLKKD